MTVDEQRERLLRWAESGGQFVSNGTLRELADLIDSLSRSHDAAKGLREACEKAADIERSCDPPMYVREWISGRITRNPEHDEKCYRCAARAAIRAWDEAGKPEQAPNGDT